MSADVGSGTGMGVGSGTGMGAVTTRAAPDGARVLVTGAYGFIGRAYCTELASRGIEFIGAVRQRAADDPRDNIVPVGDFAVADWSRLLARHRIDCIVHLAARAHRVVDDDPDPRAAYRRANVEATRRLLDAARDGGVRRFVFASTVKVHGDYTPPGVVWRESDPLEPKDEYARSKAEAEALVARCADEGALQTVILRFPMVYGPGVKANFAALFDAVRRRRWLPLGGIRNQRSLLGLANACAAIEVARIHPAATGQVYLVADGDDLSTPELVEAMADALDVRPRLIALSPSLLYGLLTMIGKRAQARRLLESLAIDSAKIRRSLEWTPPSTMHDELARLIRSHLRA